MYLSSPVHADAIFLDFLNDCIPTYDMVIEKFLKYAVRDVGLLNDIFDRQNIGMRCHWQLYKTHLHMFCIVLITVCLMFISTI